jgi:hypothetical protein
LAAARHGTFPAAKTGFESGAKAGEVTERFSRMNLVDGAGTLTHPSGPTGATVAASAEPPVDQVLRFWAPFRSASAFWASTST